MDETYTNAKEVAQAMETLHHLHMQLPQTPYDNHNAVMKKHIVEDIEYSAVEALEMFAWYYEKAFRFPAEYSRIPDGVSWFTRRPELNDMPEKHRMGIMSKVITDFFLRAGALSEEGAKGFPKLLNKATEGVIYY